MLGLSGETEADPLWLVYLNVNSICSKRMKLIQFLSDHYIDVCLINETPLVPEKDFHMPKYVFIGMIVLHKKEAPKSLSMMALTIMLSLSPISSNWRQLPHCTNIGRQPVKVLVVYLSPLHYLINAEFYHSANVLTGLISRTTLLTD